MVRYLVVADRVDQVVGEARGREVEQAQRRIQPRDLVPDRVQQMGLAETDPAVDEERVVGLRRQLRHRLAGGLGELVGVADDEGFKGIARGEAVRERHRGELTGGRGRALGLPVDLEGDDRVAAQHRANRALDRLGVVLDEPVAAVLVGRADADGVTVHRGDAAGPQPRVDGGLGDPALERGQNTGPQRVKHSQALG